jgi:phosphoribosylaminoimidazolecarboxamide formyltransferase/IMP cyclohydrolase
LGGRVKTLHPQFLHQFSPAIAMQIETNLPNHNIRFSIWCSWIYTLSLMRPDNADFAEKIELIDIGGVSLLRAAAKNFARVVVCHNIDSLDKTINQTRTTCRHR